MDKYRAGYRVIKLHFWLLFVGNSLSMWMGSQGVSYPLLLKNRALTSAHTRHHTQRASHWSKASPGQFPSPVTSPTAKLLKPFRSDSSSRSRLCFTIPCLHLCYFLIVVQVWLCLLTNCQAPRKYLSFPLFSHNIEHLICVREVLCFHLQSHKNDGPSV